MIKSGYDLLPVPIVQLLKNSGSSRPVLPGVYHVSDLVYCLYKDYYKRTTDIRKDIDTSGLLNIFRGKTFDSLYSPLFEFNQRTFIVSKAGLSITGTFDFIWDDVLYDLKMTTSNMYKLKNGAGNAYIRQVKAYLALMHENKEFLSVKKARVLMISESVVVEEVDEDPDFLDWIWNRVFLLDKAIKNMNPKNLSGSDEFWECSPKFCNYFDICEGNKKRFGGKRVDTKQTKLREGF